MKVFITKYIKISWHMTSFNIIVLMNGCFYNGPVICPRSVIMVKEVCNGPRQRRGPLQTSEAIITDRGHITEPL